MKMSSKLICGAVMILGACTGVPSTDLDTGTGAGMTAPTTSNTGLPQEVRDIAAPSQNLATARLLETDNCYWYEHQGPVETTLLPLRSTRGNPICAPDPATVAAPLAQPQPVL